MKFFAREQCTAWRFCAALEKAGIADELKGAGPFTLLAPTDGAVEEFGRELTRDMLK